LDALATSGNSSRMTLPKEPGGKAINLGRAGGWSAAAAVTALAGWLLWLQPDWKASSASLACACESAGRLTGVAAAIAEDSAGSGWLRTLETVGRSWPHKKAAVEGEGQPALSPARNMQSICTRETRADCLPGEE
jgi:hypothetical protein